MAKKQLDDALDEYRKYLVARRLSAGTIKSTMSTLNLMRRVTGNVTIDKLDHRVMDRVFVTYLWQPSTHNQKLQVYKQFFRWCRARKFAALDFDPLFGWRNIDVPEVLRTRIPRSQWANLFNECQHPIETIVFATGLYLFLRASEQQALQLKHVNLMRAEVEVYRVKTKRWDVMPITSELLPIMRTHMTWLANQGAVDPNHFLIPTRNHDMTHDANHRWVAGTGTINPTRSLSKPHRTVQRILAKNGYDTKGEGEHTMRRSGARAYFDSLCDRGYDGALRRVQSMLGHKSSRTTEIYLGLDVDRLTRNRDLSALPMFPESVVVADNVVKLFREK